jgi:hypothetical protein
MFEMMPRWFHLCAGLLAAALTSCTTAFPTHLDGKYVRRPMIVKIFIGGAFGRSYEIFSDGFTVRYKRADSMFGLEETAGTRFRPDLKQWREFRQELDRLDAWHWRPFYVQEGVADGTSWHVVVADGPNRIVYSFGSNAYPDGFDRLLAATRLLISGHEFK